MFFRRAGIRHTDYAADRALFLDQPLAFVSALRTLLAEWRHSKPNRVHV